MKNDGFIRFISTPLPMETQLAVEMRCREVMGCDDIDKLKAFCIDMMKNHARTEVVLSNAMMRMLELEAKLAVFQTPPIKNKSTVQISLTYRESKTYKTDKATSEKSFTRSVASLYVRHYHFWILDRKPFVSTLITKPSANCYEF